MFGDLQPATGISNTRPTVSVIVPVHNRSAMIDDVIAAIADQTYPAVELIVVDDGSDRDQGIPPDLGDRVRGVAATVVRKPHGGVSSARNLGVARSRGDYIVFLDSDDLLFADALADMVGVLEASGADYCVGRIVDTDFDLGRPRMSSDPGPIASILHAARWSTHASLYRRSAVFAAGPFDEALEVGEDVVFQTRIALLFGRGASCPSFVGVRRRHDHGHLSSWGRHPEHEARYIKAMAAVIAGDAAFGRERFRDRLFWTSSYLQRLLALGGDADLTAAYLRIAGALMHDSPRMRGVFIRLATPDARVAGKGAGALLTGLRRLVQRYAVLVRWRHDRDVRRPAVVAALGRLRRVIGTPRAPATPEPVDAPGIGNGRITTLYRLPRSS